MGELDEELDQASWVRDEGCCNLLAELREEWPHLICSEPPGHVAVQLGKPRTWQVMTRGGAHTGLPLCHAGFGHACAGPSQSLEVLRGADSTGEPVARKHGCYGCYNGCNNGILSATPFVGPTYHEHVSLDETSIARVSAHVLVAPAERHLESQVAELEEGERHAAVTIDLPHQREEAL